MKNAIEFFLFVSFSKFIGFLGIRRARKFASFLGTLFYGLIPIRKKVVRNNLRIIIPGAGKKEIARRTRAAYQQTALVFTELLAMPYVKREELPSWVHIPQISLINEKLSEGKGLILLTAHFGDWEILPRALTQILNMQFYILNKEQRNKAVSDWVNKYREAHGCIMVSLGISVKEIYKALLNKNPIMIVGDQRGPKEGMRVQLFGRPTAVHSGAAAMSVKSGAPIIVALPFRREDHAYTYEFTEITKEPLDGTNEEKTHALMQRYFTVLEDAVRRCPEHWLLMHNIWRH